MPQELHAHEGTSLYMERRDPHIRGTNRAAAARWLSKHLKISVKQLFDLQTSFPVIVYARPLRPILAIRCLLQIDFSSARLSALFPRSPRKRAYALAITGSTSRVQGSTDLNDLTVKVGTDNMFSMDAAPPFICSCCIKKGVIAFCPTHREAGRLLAVCDYVREAAPES